MPNWDRTPPICGMPIEEIKRRAAAGVRRRRETGELLAEFKHEFVLRRHGPGLSKKQRRVLIQASNLAIYALCNSDAQDYCHAADAINAVRRQAGMSTAFMQAILKGVAEQSAEISGEKFEVLDQLARHWLVEHFTPSDKLISIPKGKTNGDKKNE